MLVRPGEFWAVIGVNGSGKTTLLRTVLGLTPKVGGDYRWSDEAVLSYVPQRSDLDAGVPNRVMDFVAAGRDRGWSFLKWRSDGGPWLRAALEDARCSELAHQQVSNLSEGQKGRVRLARALVSNPNVLVLDEPTSAVDSVTEPQIFETLEELRRARGVTLVVVSHRPAVFAGRATHAIFVDRDLGVAVSGEFRDIVTAPSFLTRLGTMASEKHAPLGASESAE
jgi:ABC-type Mn2+/Zn2+ transport system ATPase subunit